MSAYMKSWKDRVHFFVPGDEAERERGGHGEGAPEAAQEEEEEEGGGGQEEEQVILRRGRGIDRPTAVKHEGRMWDLSRSQKLCH